MITADTITDEQMLNLYDSREITGGEFVFATSRKGCVRYAHESMEAYHDRLTRGERVRARCAEILNARNQEMKRRYIVRPCDNGGTVTNAVRDRQWDVVDTLNNYRTVANYDTRKAARDYAAELNAIYKELEQ
jgi:hypothetical protein